MRSVSDIVAFAARSFSICVISVVALFGFVPSVSAAPSSSLLYQAHLQTSAGTALADGTYSVKFSLYTTASGASSVWTAAGTLSSPTAVSVTVTNGAFSIKLGDVAAGQNSLAGLDWDRTLYLGITVESDGEMTPRRELTSVPNAFNAQQLQGMSASSTAYGNQSLFTIHQTESSAATGTRTALEVRSEGTSSALDYLFRAVNNLGTTVFSINRDGNVSTTGRLFVNAPSTSSTILGNVLLGTSTRDAVFPSGFTMDGDDVLIGGQLGVVSSVYSGVGVYVGSSATFYGESGLTRVGTYSASSSLAMTLRGNGGTSYADIDSILTLKGETGIVLDAGTGAILPASDLGSSLGSASNRFNGYFGTVTTTNIMSDVASTSRLTATNVSTTNLTVGGSLYTSGIQTSVIEATGYISTQGLIVNGGITNRFTAASSVSSLGSYATSLAGLKKMQAVGNRLYILDTAGIEVYDISDPDTENKLGTLAVPGGTIRTFYVQGRYVYAVYDDGSTGTHLGVFDASSGGATMLSEVLLSSTRDDGFNLYVSGQTAYTTSETDGGVFITDVKNPGSLRGTLGVPLANAPVDIQGEGQYVYIVTDDGVDGTFRVYDVSDQLTLESVGQVSLGTGGPWHIQPNRSVVYVTNAVDNAINVISVATPASPTLGTSVSFQSALTVHSVHLSGNRLYIGDNGGTVQIYNVDAPITPTYIGLLVAASGQNINGIAVQGTVMYTGFDASPYVQMIGIPGIVTDNFSGGQGRWFALTVEGDLQVVNNLSAENVTVGNSGLRSTGQVTAAVTSATSTAGYFVNNATSTGRGWGLYTNRLLVGSDQLLESFSETTTGTQSYVSVFGYDSSRQQFGVCLDNANSSETCLNFADTSTIYSLMADDAIGANAFDLAERYAITGSAEPGDVLVLDPDQPMHMKKSTGVPYDSTLSGVVSTRAGFILGTGGNASVALVGRVPVKVTVSNGSIQPGDPLTSSDLPGVAMKATQAGRILGRALTGTVSDGVIEAFLQPGFDASSLLQADGSMTNIAQDVGFQAEQEATALNQAHSSRALSFRGSVWENGQSAVSEFRLFNEVMSLSDARLSINYGSASSSIFTLSQSGSLTLAGDLSLAGKLYPSARGRAQHDSYIFVDDTQPSGNYISTNADGWQSQDSYDYAERYASPDALEPGDLVVVHHSERLYVQRASSEDEMLVGIVSTKPGFIAGRPQKDSYPVALAGRVPTKISTINGAIQPGDPLAPSTIPGVAVKATKAGPIVGLALEAYAGSDVGKIEVFVNPTWWGGAPAASNEATAGSRKTAQGFAEIVSGKTSVHVRLTDFTRYPHLQVTPYSQMEQGWWLDHVSPEGFDLVLGGVIGHAARFSWTAKETPDATHVSLSSGRLFDIDPVSGQIQFPPGVSDEDPPVIQEQEPDESAPVEPLSTEDLDGGTSSTEPVTDDVSSEQIPSPVEPEEVSSTTIDETTPEPSSQSQSESEPELAPETETL